MPKYSGTRSSASPIDAAEPGRQRPACRLRQAAETNAAASSSATSHTSCRSFPPRSRCASSRQPVSASGISTIAGGERRASASSGRRRWRPARRADCAPVALVAWLNEGSCTDQVASAMAVISASVISADAGELAQASPQDLAEVIRDEGDGVEVAIASVPADRLSTISSSPIRRRRARSASAVVALSCTMATRM